MQKLDPKAVWLFFFRLMGRWFVIFLVIFLVVNLHLFFVRAEVGFETSPFEFLFLSWSWVIIPIFLIFCWIWAKLSYHFYRYELREDGFRKESGVIWKKYVTIPYNRIQNVDIYRGVIARILGLSDLQIQTAGTAGVAQSPFGVVRVPEGQLPGLSREVAEQLRDELIKRVRQSSKEQGL